MQWIYSSITILEPSDPSHTWCFQPTCDAPITALQRSNPKRWSRSRLSFICKACLKIGFLGVQFHSSFNISGPRNFDITNPSSWTIFIRWYLSGFCGAACLNFMSQAGRPYHARLWVQGAPVPHENALGTQLEVLYPSTEYRRTRFLFVRLSTLFQLLHPPRSSFISCPVEIRRHACFKGNELDGCQIQVRLWKWWQRCVLPNYSLGTSMSVVVKSSSYRRGHHQPQMALPRKYLEAATVLCRPAVGAGSRLAQTSLHPS